MRTFQQRRFVSLDKARHRAFHPHWDKYTAVRPEFLGTKNFLNIEIDELIPYIDWKPFFDVWQLRGKYPNRGYPRIFNDATVG